VGMVVNGVGGMVSRETGLVPSVAGLVTPGCG
jgi:hypothetical protein